LGVGLAAASGLIPIFFRLPYLSGLWVFLKVGDADIAFSTPLLFDIGIYLTVFGTVAAVALVLEESGAGE
jgi:multicomponent Na+:H+ antiporter subunit B